MMRPTALFSFIVAIGLLAAPGLAQPVNGIEVHLPRHPVPSGTAGVATRDAGGLGVTNLTSVDVGENEFDVEVRINVGDFPLADLDIDFWLPGHCSLATTPSAASASAIAGADRNGVRVGSGAYDGSLADPYTAASLPMHDRNFPGVLIRQLAAQFPGSVATSGLGPTGTFPQTGFKLAIDNLDGGAMPRYTDLGGSFVLVRFRVRIDTMPCNRAGIPLTSRIKMNFSDIGTGVISPDLISTFQAPDPGSNFTSRLRWQQGGATFGEVYQDAAFTPMVAGMPTVVGGSGGSNPANGLVVVNTLRVFSGGAPTSIAGSTVVRFAGGADAIITDLRSISTSVQSPATLPTLGHVRVAQTGDVWFEVERRVTRAAADLSIPTLTNPAADPGVFDQARSGMNAYPNLYQYGAGAGGSPSSTAITDQFQVASYNFNSVLLGDAHTTDTRNGGTGYDGIAQDVPLSEILAFTVHGFIDGNVLTTEFVAGDFNNPNVNTTAFDPDGVAGAALPLMPVEIGGYTVEIGYDNSYWSVPSTVNPSLDYDTTRSGIQITGADNNALRVDAGVNASIGVGRTLLVANEASAGPLTADPLAGGCGSTPALEVPIIVQVPAGGIPSGAVRQIEVTLGFNGAVVDVWAPTTGSAATDDAGDASGPINDNDGNVCNDAAIHFRHGTATAGGYDALVLQHQDDDMAGGTADFVRVLFIDNNSGGLLPDTGTPTSPTMGPGSFTIGFVRFHFTGTSGGMSAIGAGAVTGSATDSGAYTPVWVDEVSRIRPAGIADIFTGLNSGFYVVDTGVQALIGPAAIIRNLRDGSSSGTFDIVPLSNTAGLSTTTTPTMTYDVASVPAAPGPLTTGFMATAAVNTSLTGSTAQTVTWTPTAAGLSAQANHQARFSFIPTTGGNAGPLMSMDPTRDLLQVGVASVVDLSEHFGFYEPQDPTANVHFLSNVLHPDAVTPIRDRWVDRHDAAYSVAPPGFHRAIQLAVDHGPAVLGTNTTTGSYDTDFNGSGVLATPGSTGAYQLIVTEFASTASTVSAGMHHVNQPRRGNTQAALQRRTELFEFRLKARGGASATATPLNPGVDSNNPGDGAFVWGTVTSLLTPNAYPHMTTGLPVNVTALNIQPGERLDGARNVAGAPAGGGGSDADDTRLLSNTIVAYTSDMTGASTIDSSSQEVNYVFETLYPPTVGPDALAISVSLNDAAAAAGTLTAGPDATLGTKDDIISGVTSPTFVFDPAAPPIMGPLPTTWPNGPYSMVNGNDGILSPDPAVDIRTGQFGRHLAASSANGGGLHDSLPTARYFAFGNVNCVGVPVGDAQRLSNGRFRLKWRGTPSIGQGAALAHDAATLPGGPLPQLSDYTFDPFTGQVSGSMMIPDNFADVLEFTAMPVSNFNTGLPPLSVNIAIYENDILDGLDDEELFVDLIAVAAEPFDGEVLVTWSSGSEIDNAGYNVYRSTTGAGPWQKVNASLIPGLVDSEIGGDYYFIDRDVSNGTTYYYVIEDVELTGLLTLHTEWIVDATPLAGLGVAHVDPAGYVSGAETIPGGAGGGTSGGGGGSPGDPPVTQNEQVGGAGREDPYDQSRREGFGGRLDDADEDGYVLTFTYPTPSVTPVSLFGVAGHRVEMLGLDRMPTVGQPDVPVDRVVVDTQGRGIDRVEVIRLETARWPQPLTVFPVTATRASFDLDLADLQQIQSSGRREGAAGAIRPTMTRVAEQVIEENRLVTHAPFATTDPYFSSPLVAPLDLVAPGDEVNVRGTLYQTVELSPVRYRPSTGELTWIESITFRVHLGDQPREEPATAAPDGAQLVIEGGLAAGKPALTEEGIYRIEFSRLAAAAQPGHGGFGSGMPLGGGSRGSAASASEPGAGSLGFDPGVMAMFDDGRPMPIHVVDNGDGVLGDGDSVIFYAKAPIRECSPENVLWAVAGLSSPEMRSVPAHPRGSPSTVVRSRTTVRFEEDHLSQMGATSSADRFYWAALVASPAHGMLRSTYDFDAHLTGVAQTGGMAELRLSLVGMSSDSQFSPDHHVEVVWNGSTLGEVSFDGTEVVEAALTLPQGAIDEGENQLQIIVIGDTAAIDLIAFQGFEVDYDRELDAAGATRFEFSTPDLGVIAVTGLAAASAADIFVVDVTDPDDPILLTSPEVTLQGSTYQVRFDASVLLATGMTQPAGARRYLLTSTPGVVPPIVTNQQSNLISSAHQADMIMIVPQSWTEAIEPLAQHRRTEGLSVAVVAIEDVYDTFSFGDLDPQAIREFIELAYSTWTRPAPAYVLLAGDGHYDPQDRLGTGNPSFVPVHMLQTFNLFAASDNYFATVAGTDSLPDLAIGRLPARGADELASMVSKIIAYETQGAPAMPTATIATDPAFTDQVTQVVSTFPGVLQVVSTQTMPLSSVRDAVRNAFANGDSHIAFYGHGSITQWGQGAGILKVADLALLPQGSPAVVAAYNCLSGYFQHPSVQGLGEELIRVDSGGAVAVFAPTATTGSGADLRAIERFVENAYSIGYRRAGDILTKVKIDLIGTSTFSEDFVRTWTLIGDPAMKIQR